VSLDEFDLVFTRIGSNEKIAKKDTIGLGEVRGKVVDVESWTSGIKKCRRVIESAAVSIK
jgi:hypothetical protein